MYRYLVLGRLGRWPLKFLLASLDIVWVQIRKESLEKTAKRGISVGVGRCAVNFIKLNSEAHFLFV